VGRGRATEEEEEEEEAGATDAVEAESMAVVADAGGGPMNMVRGV